MIYISLKEYLGRLDAQEQRKPGEQRRHVPTLTALAADINMHPVSLNRLANGHVKQLPLDTADAIIQAMRRRGFDMQVTDLIGFQPNVERV